MERTGNKKFLRRFGLVAAFALGTLFVQSGIAGIATSKHNLGAASTSTTHLAAGQSEEICVFCHTPHGASVTAPAPLWNRVVPTSPAYVLYGSTSTYGTQTMDSAVVQPGVGSLICLSCHDGVQAMDNVINAPGSGGYNTAGSRMGAAWVGNATAGVLNAGVITNIGNDLNNDHPIGIQYCGGGVNNVIPATATAAAANTGCADADFYGSSTNTGRLLTQLISGSQVWWVDTGALDSVRRKTDMVLYSRASADFTGATGTLVPSVECATCHDPHSTNATFLRMSNAASAVCLACHVK